MTMSGTIREWEKEQELLKECVFCGNTAGLEMDHLIPRSRGGPDSADNMVWSCKPCNTSRNNRGVFEWLGLKKKDNLHRLVAGKYLKLLLPLHQAAGTIDIAEKDLPQQLCPKCGLTEVCQRNGTAHELTCFCLESVLS
ncbi:MAG: HNH endonuclease [Deltaproteobacteria bacterium]|nr:HNH endonuclease [Deltaproteobacteria bacterium]